MVYLFHEDDVEAKIHKIAKDILNLRVIDDSESLTKTYKMTDQQKIALVLAVDTKFRLSYSTMPQDLMDYRFNTLSDLIDIVQQYVC